MTPELLNHSVPAMRIKTILCATLLSSLLACGDDSSLHLFGGEPASAPQQDAGAEAHEPGEPTTVSRVEPILEGRKYRVELREPLETAHLQPGEGSVGLYPHETELPESVWSTHDISFDSAPRLDPAAINIVQRCDEVDGCVSATVVSATGLIALACAHSIASTSEIIPIGTVSTEWYQPTGSSLYINYRPVLNPGTAVVDTGAGLRREMPEYSHAVHTLITAYESAQSPTSGCVGIAYWKQAMHLCVAEAYLGLATSGQEYEIVVAAVEPPNAKVLPTDDQGYACDATTNQCQKLAYVLQQVSGSAEDIEARLAGVRNFLLAELQAGVALDPRLPERNILESDGEYVDRVLAPYYGEAIARYPVQQQEDRATLAFLAENHFLTAQDIGQEYLECKLTTSSSYEPEWLDTYDHNAYRANDLILTGLIDAMDGSLQAAETAQLAIINLLDKGLGPNATDQERQLFWRGRTNSRLECAHAWHDLAPRLFQSPDTRAAEVENSPLFPVFHWPAATAEVARAERLIREARINPQLVEGGVSGLSSALWASMRSDLRYSLADTDPGDADAMLASLGIDQETLRSAAMRIIDSSEVLGRPIIELNGAEGMDGSSPIEGTSFYYAHGVAPRTDPVSPMYLYARTAGEFSDNSVAQSTGLPKFAYSGLAGGIAYSGKILNQIAETYQIPQDVGPPQPFLALDATAPPNTNPAPPREREIVEQVQAGIQLAHTVVPEVLWFCENGFLIFHSDEEPTDVPEAWRGEAGLECATQGRFGDVPCDPGHYQIEYSVAPTLGTTRLYASNGFGKHAMGGLLNLGDVTPSLESGERIYFTRRNAVGGREPIVAITFAEAEGSACNYYPFGQRLMDEISTCLAADVEEPSEPAFCCEGLPCDLKVPLEDSLQSTPAREVESSFMHYVSLARQAADRADELGEQLFRQGLEMDMRAEAAREDLERECGGVVNIDRLTPRVCESDDDCCEGEGCAGHCMASSGLEGGTQYCTASTPVEALQSNTANQCGATDPCGMGQFCVEDGTSSSCAQSCDPEDPDPCSSGECLDGSSGAFCATRCDEQEDCGAGMACRRNAELGFEICMPSPVDDLRSIEQCLGVGSAEGSIIPAALGTKTLFAWRYEGLPICVCPSTRTDCPPAFDPETGVSACPALTADTRNAPPDSIEVDITNTLDFETGISSNDAATALACRAIAELRAFPEEPLVPQERNVATIMAQRWMSAAGFKTLAETVDPEYDAFGFLTLSVGQNPWMRTGSTIDGPIPSERFPYAPLIDPDNENDQYLCDTDPVAGRPFQCKWIGGDGLNSMSEAHLIRVTQVMRFLAMTKRIPMARHMELPSPERYRILPGHTLVTPGWLADDYPGAIIHRVARDGADRDSFMFDDQSNEDDGDTEGLFVHMAQCVVNAGPWEDTIGCGDISQTGATNTAPFRAWINGQRNYGLWALDASNQNAPLVRSTSGRGGWVGGDTIARSALDLRGPTSYWQWLNRMAEGEALGADDPAPIASAVWHTGGRQVTVAEAMDALELACLMAANPGGPQVGLSVGCDPETLNETPSITGPRDFPKLTQRLRCAADVIDGELQKMWVPEIPLPVAQAIKRGEVTDTVPAFRGAYAITVSELQGAFQDVSESTGSIASQLRSFANELTLAQSTLERLENDAEILDWGLVADISAQVSACAAGAANLDFGSAVTCANAAVQIASAVAIEKLQQENLELSERDTLTTLSQQFGDRIDNLERASERLRKAYTAIQTNMAQLDITRNAAERAAAKALFLRSDATGRVYNVNTAMHRNMNTLKVRYDRALSDAKRMSFIARRSIEQRLGMSLEDLTAPMLLVEAPATWANSACSMTGIDYDRIRDETKTPDEVSLEDDFSNAFIGDYVTKLENFVESYRFEYPFNDGNDVAVVSLRDDIRGVTAPCAAPGPNLLYFTAQMLEDMEETAEVPQWHDVSDTGTVVTLAPTGTSPKAPDLENEGIISRLPGGAAYQMSALATPEDPSARAFWGQEVWLEAGLYQLSWYERHGATDAECTAPPSPGWALLDGEVISIEAGAPFDLGGPQLVPLTIGVTTERNLAEDFVQSCWRRWVRTVEVPESQPALVRFGLTVETDSVVWGQPQLEMVANEDTVAVGEGEGGGFNTFANPRAFFPTTDVLTAAVGQCEDTTGAQLQTLFASGESFCEPVCADGTGESCAHLDSSASLGQDCYHQIQFAITPGMIERGEVVSIARTNFNYRFSRFGINLVGTGVRDCEDSAFPSSCYASGYIQYTLQHDGPYTVTNHDGDRVEVPLFKGRIEHAKALTAERFLTNPLSGADRSLMEDFWRNELRGRPLQGQYTLRIYDADDGTGNNILRMDRLEDVQLLFEYNYWTRTE